MREVENQALFEQIRSFARKMHTMREYLLQANKLYYKYQEAKMVFGCG